MLAIKERVIEFDIAPPTRHISEWRPEEISYSLRYYHSYNERLIGLQSRMQKLQNIPHTASLSLRDPKKIALFNLLEATSKAIEIVQLLKNEFGVLCAGLAAHRMFESIYTKTRASSTNLPVAPGMPFVLTGFSDGFAPMQRPLYSSVTILDFTSKSETLMRIIQKQASPASPSLPTSTAINSSLFSAVIFVREPTLAEHLAYFIEYLRPHLFPKVIGVTSVTGSGLATSTQAKRKRHNTWMSPGSKSFAAINAFINASGVNVLVASNISDKGEIDDM